MKPFILMCCVFLFTYSNFSFSNDTQESAPSEMLDLLSSASHPGEGNLILAGETEQETIKMGADTGIYGVGLTFKGEWLPEPYKNDVGKSIIIQISMGTLKSKLDGKVPQFGLLTLVNSELPKETIAFTFPEPGKSLSSPRSEARALFMSPTMQLSQTDQEKLQNTFFGRSGGVTVTPVGDAKQVAIKNKETKVFFKTQNMKVDFQMALGTPFSGLEKKLTGSIILPVYTPSGKAAEALAMRLSDSLQGAQSAPKPQRSPERKITGSKSVSSPK